MRVDSRTFNDDDLLSGVLRAGAAGFVLKDSPAEELIRAVRAVGRGNTAAAPAGPPVSIDELTPRERDVLALIAKGHTNTEIADALFISGLMVKTHIGRIFTKLGLRDRAAAIVFANEHRIIAPS
jgi:DNA-binding NarL/FixJ family response regulator